MVNEWSAGSLDELAGKCGEQLIRFAPSHTFGTDYERCLLQLDITKLRYERWKYLIVRAGFRGPYSNAERVKREQFAVGTCLTHFMVFLRKHERGCLVTSAQQPDPPASHKDLAFMHTLLQRQLHGGSNVPFTRPSYFVRPHQCEDFLTKLVKYLDYLDELFPALAEDQRMKSRNQIKKLNADWLEKLFQYTDGKDTALRDSIVAEQFRAQHEGPTGCLGGLCGCKKLLQSAAVAVKSKTTAPRGRLYELPPDLRQFDGGETPNTVDPAQDPASHPGVRGATQGSGRNVPSGARGAGDPRKTSSRKEPNFRDNGEYWDYNDAQARIAQGLPPRQPSAPSMQSVPERRPATQPGSGRQAAAATAGTGAASIHRSGVSSRVTTSTVSLKAGEHGDGGYGRIAQGPLKITPSNSESSVSDEPMGYVPPARKDRHRAESAHAGSFEGSAARSKGSGSSRPAAPERTVIPQPRKGDIPPLRADLPRVLPTSEPRRIEDYPRFPEEASSISSSVSSGRWPSHIPRDPIPRSASGSSGSPAYYSGGSTPRPISESIKDMPLATPLRVPSSATRMSRSQPPNQPTATRGRGLDQSAVAAETKHPSFRESKSRASEQSQEPQFEDPSYDPRQPRARAQAPTKSVSSDIPAMLPMPARAIGPLSTHGSASSANSVASDLDYLGDSASVAGPSSQSEFGSSPDSTPTSSPRASLSGRRQTTRSRLGEN